MTNDMSLTVPLDEGAPAVVDNSRRIGGYKPDATQYPKEFEITLDKAVKYDADKPRYDLIPADALLELAKLYGMGAKKYEDRNWEKGMEWNRIFRALQSHAWAWQRGEQFDPEDGQPHMASVAWCALALLSYEMRGVGEDNRAELPY